MPKLNRLRMFQIEQPDCANSNALDDITAIKLLINQSVNRQKTTHIQNGTFCFWSCNYPISMKRSELTNRQKLLVPCPICGAAIGAHCKMYSGLGRRKEPHAERKYQAIQHIEHGNPASLENLGKDS
jgi:hypothetical protein